MEKNASNGVDFGGRTREMWPDHELGPFDPKTRPTGQIRVTGVKKTTCRFSLSMKKNYMSFWPWFTGLANYMSFSLCQAGNYMSFFWWFQPFSAQNDRSFSDLCCASFQPNDMSFFNNDMSYDPLKKIKKNNNGARGGACRGVFGQFFLPFYTIF